MRWLCFILQTSFEHGNVAPSHIQRNTKRYMLGQSNSILSTRYSAPLLGRFERGIVWKSVYDIESSIHVVDLLRHG